MENRQPTLIFLSHASRDADLAKVLASEIEFLLGPNYRVFVSSRPDAIRSGDDWFDTILARLDEASALIILVTSNSENRLWIGFEFGFFWKAQASRHIYALKHPSAILNSPLDVLQAKSVTDRLEMQNFFEALFSQFGRRPPAIGRNNAVEAILEVAMTLNSEPAERTLANFSRKLAQSEWDQFSDGDKTIWVCMDDALFQIVMHTEGRRAEFGGEWVEKFGTKRCFRHSVRLTIAGSTIRIVDFLEVDSTDYFVPEPSFEIDASGRRRLYQYRRSSLDYLLAQVIGNFGALHSVAEFAQVAGIQVVG